VVTQLAVKWQSKCSHKLRASGCEKSNYSKRIYLSSIYITWKEISHSFMTTGWWYSSLHEDAYHLGSSVGGGCSQGHPYFWEKNKVQPPAPWDAQRTRTQEFSGRSNWRIHLSARCCKWCCALTPSLQVSACSKVLRETLKGPRSA
jgi:hypothetical protein